MGKISSEKMRALGELLKSSLLADDIKNSILSKADSLGAETFEQLLEMLRREKDYAGDLTKDLQKFQADADKRWRDIEATQQAEIAKWASETAGKLKAE